MRCRWRAGETRSGALTLRGANTYTGPTHVVNGTVEAGIANNAFGSNSAVTLDNTVGVTLDLTGFNNAIGSLTGGGGNGGKVSLGAATLTIGGDNTSPAAYAGVISGTGGVTKTGTGALTLTGSNAYSGNTVVTTGTLLVDNLRGSATGTGAVFVQGRN